MNKLWATQSLSALHRYGYGEAELQFNTLGDYQIKVPELNRTAYNVESVERMIDETITIDVPVKGTANWCPSRPDCK